MMIATYNIHYGVGRDGVHDLTRAISSIQHADIIALQEVDVNWDRSANQNQPALIKALLPEHELAWGPTVDVRKTLTAPAKVADDAKARRQFGNIILSRYPILSIRNFLFPKYGASRYLDIQKGALEALIATPIGLVRVYSTHLCSTSASQRQEQMALLLDQHSRAPDEGPVLSGQHPDATWTSEPALPEMPKNAILMGDFNFTDTSEAYIRAVGEYSERFGHLTRRGGFIDAWSAQTDKRAESKEASPKSLKERVDYCFLSVDIAKHIQTVELDLEADGSDHQPLFVTLGG